MLALLNIIPKTAWSEAENPLMGITPIMDWVAKHYAIKYAPNTRETFRRQTMHQFMQAGIVLINPDKPERRVNSPKTVYQIEPSLLEALRLFGKRGFKKNLDKFIKERKTLAEIYAKEREMHQIPIKVSSKKKIKLSAGKHSKLIKDIIDEFATRFVPGGKLIYVGDTGDKLTYFDNALLLKLGISIDIHGKMPDVVIYLPSKNWLVLIEAVTSHGPMDSKRQKELSELFRKSTAGLVYVSAFPNKKVMLKYLDTIAWETEVWLADNPSHLIHFNGIRFLGPY